MTKTRKRKNPLRIDPTRTGLLRRQFQAEMRKRCDAIRKAIWEMLWEDDALGLKPREPLAVNAPANKRAFEFHTTDDKLKSFNKWFQDQVNKKLLDVGKAEKPWLAKWVESAYKRGAIRAYMDVHRPELGKSADFYLGSQEQFLRSAFETSERVSKIRMLGTRAFEELKGISGTMSQQISRVLADGLANGKGPYEIARTMSKTIQGINTKRAKVLARTEVIHAHAEGQLDAFEDLGVEDVGVMAEWSTAGDDLVCPMCDALSGVVMTVAEARGLLPRHPNCRCAWIPANVGESGKGQITTKSRKTARIQKSILAERPSGSISQARRKSVWAGKTKRFTTV
jgi:SPP1 gp7 family putative phage head morphogenesis protein